MINRLTRLRNLLAKKSLDAIFISSVPNIIYFTGFTGFSFLEREAYLLITKNAACIITDRRYSEAVAEEVSHFKLLEVSSKNSAEGILKKLYKVYKIKKLGIEEKNITLYENETLLSHYNNTYHCSDIVDSLRTIKEKDELELIENACGLGDKTFDYILKEIKPGITEKELAVKIEMFIKTHGADISFAPIVAFGKNSSVPHHQTTDKRLTVKDKFVLLDFGVKLNSYCSDMTRTVFFGKPTTEQKKMYETVFAAQQKSLDLLKFLILNHKLIPAKEADRAARDYIISKGYPTIPHSLGHGIGIEVHEAPRLSPKSKDSLKEGMVFSIEPGIYLPGFGGIRIEDLAVVESRKLRIITHSPKTIIEL